MKNTSGDFEDTAETLKKPLSRRRTSTYRLICAARYNLAPFDVTVDEPLLTGQDAIITMGRAVREHILNNYRRDIEGMCTTREPVFEVSFRHGPTLHLHYDIHSGQGAPTHGPLPGDRVWGTHPNGIRIDQPSIVFRRAADAVDVEVESARNGRSHMYRLPLAGIEGVIPANL